MRAVAKEVCGIGHGRSGSMPIEKDAPFRKGGLANSSRARLAIRPEPSGASNGLKTRAAAARRCRPIAWSIRDYEAKNCETSVFAGFCRFWRIKSPPSGNIWFEQGARRGRFVAWCRRYIAAASWRRTVSLASSLPKQARSALLGAAPIEAASRSANAQ
jgi:hypothetical protein